LQHVDAARREPALDVAEDGVANSGFEGESASGSVRSETIAPYVPPSFAQERERVADDHPRARILEGAGRPLRQ
jgi:hypothetical protein